MNKYIEQVKPCGTADEMRVEIARLSRHDSMVRAVLNSAEYRGLSGEDKYLYLAYISLQQLQQFKEGQMVDAMLSLKPMFIIARDKS